MAGPARQAKKDKSEVEYLATELTEVTRRRPPEVFKDPAKGEIAEFPRLVDAVQNILPSTWEEDPTRALIRVLEKVVNECLPDDGYPQDKSGVWRSSLSWREIGQILCGLRKDLPPDYDYYASEVSVKSGFAESTHKDNFSRDVSRPFRLLLARTLLDLAERSPATDGNTESVEDNVCDTPNITAPVISAPSEPIPPQPPSLTVQPKQQADNPELDTAIAELANEVRYRLRTDLRLRDAHENPIQLHWRTVSEELTDSWESIRDTPGQNEPLTLDSTFNHIIETYNAVPSGRLVILGPPGFGKTVLVTELAIKLLEEGNELPYGRVPIIFNLSSWDAASQSLRDWMIDFLLATYPRLFDTAQKRDLLSRLVYWDHILPILDGFDEIAHIDRGNAMKMLNKSFDRTNRFVLTSRYSEYYEAVLGSGVLTAAAVVELDSLNMEDIATYLRDPNWGPAIGRMRAIQPYLEPYACPSDIEAERLFDALRTPLMLSLARLAYTESNANPNELLDFNRFRRSSVIQAYLLDRFCVLAYSQPPQDRDVASSRYNCSPEQARSWLGCIAAYLCALHSLDLPAWSMHGLPTKVVDSLSYGLFGRQRAAAIILPTWSKWKSQPETNYSFDRRSAIRNSAIIGLGFMLQLLGSAWADKRLFDTATLVVTPIAAVVSGLAVFAILRYLLKSEMWVRSTNRHSMRPARSSRMTKLLIAGVLWTLTDAIILLGEWSVLGEIRVDPSLYLLPISIAVYFYFDYLPVSLWDAAGPKKFRLSLRGKLPWRRLAFLEDAYRRGVLRKNGGMYQFRHRTLQERLAEQWIESQPPRVTKQGIMQQAKYFIENGCDNPPNPL